MLLPFSKTDKANKCTKPSNLAQMIPTLRRASTVSIKLTYPLHNSRMVLHYSRNAQPSRNSYFAQSHSKIVKIPTLRRTYTSVRNWKRPHIWFQWSELKTDSQIPGIFKRRPSANIAIIINCAFCVEYFNYSSSKYDCQTNRYRLVVLREALKIFSFEIADNNSNNLAELVARLISVLILVWAFIFYKIVGEERL